MGFGSYDESEQEKQDVDTDVDEDNISIHENDYEGEVTYETNASTDDLLQQLEDIQDDDDPEEQS